MTETASSKPVRVTEDEYFEATRRSAKVVAGRVNEGVFEIGLCLAGAVSAGAYTAGVLDFLLEALECWEAQRKADPSRTPSHQVVIKGLAGASAGSIVGGLLGTSLHRSFPHGLKSGNPLYKTWVTGVDILNLLGTGDLHATDKRVLSLLDCTRLDQLRDEALQNAEGPDVDRPYIAEPFTLTFTQGNLAGVPFNLPFRSIGDAGGVAGLDALACADHITFSLSLDRGNAAAQWRDELTDDEPANCYKDRYRLVLPALDEQDRSRRFGRWWWFVEHALASGAFPAGLKHRELKRRTSDYDYRYVAHHGYLVKLQPKPGLPAEYRYNCVDGGVMNNEPVALTHELLCGPLGSLSDGCGENRIATRAIVMVDPFPDPSSYKPPAVGDDFIKALFGLLGAWKDQARASAAELALANDENEYSRFLVSPSRGKAFAISNPDQSHLAAGGLGAFAGFLHQSLREHDFALGRYNCQQFLRSYFTLPHDHPLFAGQIPSGPPLFDANDPLAAQKQGERVLIPLYGSAALHKQLPDWPRDCIRRSDLQKIYKQLKNRLDKLLPRLLSRVNHGFAGMILSWGIKTFGEPKLADQIMQQIATDLVKRGLLSESQADWHDDPFPDHYSGGS